MIEIFNIAVMNMPNAIRGMRNPMESWDKSDSYLSNGEFTLGDSDLKLALNLATAGSDHGKFLRQIFVSMDITAPEYWWKEYATYKVATVENSTSTMHRLGTRLLTPEDFSWDEEWTENQILLEFINRLITIWQETKDKNTWRRIIQLLPMSFNYTRTVTLNYEVLRNMYNSRKNHKLVEWKEFCNIIELLPYSELITASRKH